MSIDLVRAFRRRNSMKIQTHHNFMLNFTKIFFTSLKRPVFAYLISLSFTLITLCSVLFYWIESDQNPKIENFFDSIYYSVTIMTGVGLGDIAPVTIYGKALSMLMMLAGTAIFVSFTAVLSAVILEIEMVHFKK